MYCNKTMLTLNSNFEGASLEKNKFIKREKVMFEKMSLDGLNPESAGS